MGRNGKPLLLNLGCGFNKFSTHINVDKFDICEPDVVWDLSETPYPWPPNTFDGILASHILEHVENWWGMFTECARILRPGGTLEIRVPHQSSDTAWTYRDHLHVFSMVSFYGIEGFARNSNAWASLEQNSVPLISYGYQLTPHQEYQWMAKWCPWLLTFCANHLRNFIWEARYYFRKTRPE